MAAGTVGSAGRSRSRTRAAGAGLDAARAVLADLGLAVDADEATEAGARPTAGGRGRTAGVQAAAARKGAQPRSMARGAAATAKATTDATDALAGREGVPEAAVEPAEIVAVIEAGAARRATLEPLPELPAMTGPGRRTALTPATQDVICRAIEAGMPYLWAARLAGVPDNTVSLWRSRGAADLVSGADTVYSRLVNAIKTAEATAIARSLAGLAEGGRDWTRHAWLLERRWPEEYGRRDAVAVGVQGEVRIVVEHVADWHARDVIEVQPAAVTAGA